MAIWDDVITDEDRAIFDKAGFGKRQGFGSKPAVLVIDVTYGFIGDRPEPILQSIERFPTSCGEVGWDGVKQIERLLLVARGRKIPVIYTVPGQLMGSQAATKRVRETQSEKELKLREEPKQAIVREIAPEHEDIVISKLKASAFFGTPLISYLVGQKIDTLLITGCTTSGCVRATAADAFSHNFRVGVLEECVWDRVQVSHKVSLFDLNGKYADVVSLMEVEDYLSKLPGGESDKI